MTEQSKEEIKKLEREVNLLKKKLKRSENNRMLFEEAQERSQTLQQTLFNDLELKTAELKSSEKKTKKRIDELKDTQKAMLNITEDLDIEKQKAQESNKKISDSIEYASLIQSALIPEKSLFTKYFKDSFTIWDPKDTVGGDIYLFEELRSEDECLLMVIDCTGHGVPGAFVTMLVKAIERQIIAIINSDDSIEVSPAWCLQYFNQTMKKLLKQENSDAISNAGFDGGIVYYNKKEKIIKFSGAETPLFYIENGELKTIKGDRHSIGYKNQIQNMYLKSI